MMLARSTGIEFGGVLKECLDDGPSVVGDNFRVVGGCIGEELAKIGELSEKVIGHRMKKARAINNCS